MPPYIAVKPCHSRGRRNPFPDTIFSVSRERRKKGDRRVARTHSYLRAGGAVVEAAGTALDDLLLGDGNDVGGDAVETHALEQVLGLLVDVERARLAVLGEVESGDLGDVLVLSLTLLFLKLERDTTNGTTLDTLHQMSGVSGNLVPEPLGGNDGDLITDPLVGLEVQRQLGVVTLNDDLGGLLDGLSSDATHFGDLLCELEEEVVVGRGGGCRVSCRNPCS